MSRKTKNKTDILLCQNYMEKRTKWLKETYFDNFRKVQVKELLEIDLKYN